MKKALYAFLAADLAYLLYLDHTIIKKQAEMLDDLRLHRDWQSQVMEVLDDIVRRGGPMNSLDAVLLDSINDEFKYKSGL